MRLKLAILLVLPLLLVSCANRVLLYPIDKQDIFRVPKGTMIGTIPTDRDGYFLSDQYLDEVGKATVK
jgi:hypothetical protein